MDVEAGYKLEMPWIQPDLPVENQVGRVAEVGRKSVKLGACRVGSIHQPPTVY